MLIQCKLPRASTFCFLWSIRFVCVLVLSVISSSIAFVRIDSIRFNSWLMLFSVWDDTKTLCDNKCIAWMILVSYMFLIFSFIFFYFPFAFWFLCFICFGVVFYLALALDSISFYFLSFGFRFCFVLFDFRVWRNTHIYVG